MSPVPGETLHIDVGRFLCLACPVFLRAVLPHINMVNRALEMAYFPDGGSHEVDALLEKESNRRVRLGSHCRPACRWLFTTRRRFFRAGGRFPKRSPGETCLFCDAWVTVLRESDGHREWP